MSLRLENLRVTAGTFTLEIDAAIDLPVTGIFGPSGAGKTSLLEVLVGLRQASAGRIALGETELLNCKTGLHVPPRARRIGYVPQDLALFPHLNVRSNLLYGYGRSGEEHAGFTLPRVLEVMELTPLLHRDVTLLSGGEQQRVAFARALLSAPRLLLLDEPMSNLDDRLKERLIPFLLRIRDEFRIPLVYVTHDAGEIAALCNEVLFLEHGRLTGRGAATEAVRRPDGSSSKQTS